jgi:hypothetical protein
LWIGLLIPSFPMRPSPQAACAKLLVPQGVHMMFRFRIGTMALAVLSAASWALLPETALAEAVPFTCTILEDGGSVRINVSNPARVPRSCLVACQFSTPIWGGEAQIICAHRVAAGAKDIEMCTKSAGGVQLVKQTHGSADCIRR